MLTDSRVHSQIHLLLKYIVSRQVINHRDENSINKDLLIYGTYPMRVEDIFGDFPEPK
jgi:hypothetical protein